jgi:hypothetical protein
MVVVAALRTLFRIIEGLLLITGLSSFLGFQLDIFVIRDFMLRVLPPCADEAFASLTAFDYAALLAYAIVVVGHWVAARFGPWVRTNMDRARGKSWYGTVEGMVQFAALVIVPMWFALTVSYVVADIIFGGCGDARCLDSDEIGGWDIGIVLASFVLIMVSTIGAVLLGAVQQQRADEPGPKSEEPPGPQ